MNRIGMLNGKPVYDVAACGDPERMVLCECDGKLRPRREIMEMAEFVSFEKTAQDLTAPSPPREPCPWCGSPDLRTNLRDQWECAGCGAPSTRPPTVQPDPPSPDGYGFFRFAY